MQAVNHKTLRPYRSVKIQMIEAIEETRFIKGVLRAIDSHARESVWCWPSNKTIGKHIGVSDRTAARHMRKAIEGGWIEVKQVPGRANHYSIKWDFVFSQLSVEQQRAVMQKITRGQVQKQETVPAPVETQLQPKTKPAKRSFGFPAGYSPYGLPSSKPAAAAPSVNQLAGKARRWNKHLEPDDFKYPDRIQAMFDRAVQLGIVKDAEFPRLNVWALAINCRKAENPGAMFRRQIEAEDFSKISIEEEAQAKSEIQAYDEETYGTSAISFEAYQGGA